MVDQTSSVAKGIMLTAMGRPEGISHFRGSFSAFLASLMPMFLFSLVVTIWLLGRHQIHDAVAQILAAPAGLLAGPVASHWMAVRLRREILWARYATAGNWLQWACAPLVLIGFALVQSGMVLAPLGVIAVLIYAIWLQLFLAHSALALNWGRAVLLVSVVALANLVFVLAPSLLRLPRLGG